MCERLADVSYSSLCHVQLRVKVSFSMKNRWGEDCQEKVVIVAVKRIISSIEVLTNSQICGIIIQILFERETCEIRKAGSNTCKNTIPITVNFIILLCNSVF